MGMIHASIHGEAQYGGKVESKTSCETLKPGGSISESSQLLREICILDDNLNAELLSLFEALAPVLPTGFFDIDSATTGGGETLPRTELGRRLHGLLEFRLGMIREVRRVASNIDIPAGPF